MIACKIFISEFSETLETDINNWLAVSQQLSERFKLLQTTQSQSSFLKNDKDLAIQTTITIFYIR